MHYIARSIAQQGFTPRNHATGAGHDLPIVVRETSGSESPLGAESLEKWRSTQVGRHGVDYPPEQPWMGRTGEEFFCSLGNGHFFQALNLYWAQHSRKFDDEGQVREQLTPWQQCACRPSLTSAGDGGGPCVVAHRGTLLHGGGPCPGGGSRARRGGAGAPAQHAQGGPQVCHDDAQLYV